MMRSWRLVAAELRRRHPDLAADIDAGEVYALRWLLEGALWERSARASIAIAWPLRRA